MSGPDSPDTPPPEVPEEFAAAYTEAYRRALESGEYGELDPSVVPADPAYAREAAQEAQESIGEVDPQEVVAVGEHRPAGAMPAAIASRLQDAGWLTPALLTGAAVVLVLGAYGIGKLVSDEGGDTTGTVSPTNGPSSVTSPSREASRSSSASDKESESPDEGSSAPANAWEGSVAAVTADEPEASCTSRPSVDSAGKTVHYRASNTLDGDATTAWRCDGSAIGERLTFELPEGTELGEVGLIPGYAKTDPKNGADRYVENNRITRVRWTFGDDVSVVQNFDPDPENREVQTIRVPRTSADEVTLEILEVSRGPRNTTAISEVAFAAAEGDDSGDDD